MKHTKEERAAAVKQMTGAKLRIETRLIPDKSPDAAIIEGEIHAEGNAGAVGFLLLNSLLKLEEQDKSVRQWLVKACKEYIKED